jgi:hypothetical protein
MKEIKKLSLLLNRVYLNGKIKECVLRVKNKKLIIQSVDMTNSLFLYCSCNRKGVGLEKGSYGIGNLEILCKFFSVIDNNKENLQIKKEDNKLILSKDNSNTFKYLLTDIQVIPTDINQKDAIIKITKNSIYEIELEEQFKKEYNSYTSLIGLQVIQLKMNKNQKVFLCGGREGEHQFEISLGKASLINKTSDKKKEGIQLSIYNEHFGSILQQLKWDGETIPKIKFAPQNPLVIEQNKNNLWALLPITDY